MIPESELYWIDPKRELPKDNHSDVLVLYANDYYPAVFVRRNDKSLFCIKHNGCPYVKKSSDIQGWLPIPRKEDIR